MPKTKLGINVFQASQERISYLFDNFPRIYVSFSGGKDSTVMLHMVAQEAIKRNRKIGVLFIDLEGQYKLTIDHIHACLDMYKDNIELYWICLPIHLRNAVSMYETHWICWDKDKKEAWIREPPMEAITDESYFPFFTKGMEFEDFVPEFGAWFGKGELTACCVGIRSDESLNRYRTISSLVKIPYEGHQWTTQLVGFNNDKLYNAYPIYDWKTKDIWIYQGKNLDKPSNHLYDMMYKAGVPLSLQRICQPYGDDQRRGLWLFHLIEPETWSRIVARVNGANSGAMYIQETGNINGYRRISKPVGHTWQSFAMLLLNSLPPKTKNHFANKIAVFIHWWLARGYPDGIPDEAPYELETKRGIPSWRRVCKALLRNDYWCKGLGFSQHKSEAYSKYLDLMRRRREEWRLPLENSLTK